MMIPVHARRLSWQFAYAFSIVVVLSASGCDGDQRQPDAFAGGTVVSLRDQAAIRATYLERLRLGLGNPFRLIDFALSDPRLGEDFRRDVGKELLDRTLAGEMYEIDPGALLPNFESHSAESLARAAGHLTIIEDAITAGPDSRAGELTIRLAYQLARLETSVSASTLSGAVSTAALIRDRELAAQDARRIVIAAEAAGVEAIDLVREWRNEGRFSVERPALQSIGRDWSRKRLHESPTFSIRYAGLGRGAWHLVPYLSTRSMRCRDESPPWTIRPGCPHELPW
jgi:hypothetical protein